MNNIKQSNIHYNIRDIKDNYEYAILLIPQINNKIDIDEITALSNTAGAKINKVFIQKIREINPATYVGEGKLEEINTYLKEHEDIELVIFDGELSPSQTLNIQSCLSDIKVIDRTTLILDIFAKNAISGEGKIQVELAQLKYLYPRLKGKGKDLSRLGGGIGTRGPGETKLESDRRHIKTRIKYLEKVIDKMSQNRELQKHSRLKNQIKTVALVGYTNAGKSTLMKALTNCDVLIEDKLFATLDTKTTTLKLDNIEVLLVDTVGFVKNIPTHIIDAFKSTLITAVEADLILNVCDLSNDYISQSEVTYSILKELNCQSEIINVYNKGDIIDDLTTLPKDSIVISAKNNVGLDNLKKIIEIKLFSDYTKFSLKLPYFKYNEILKLKKFTQNYVEEFFDEYVIVKIVVKNSALSKFKQFNNWIC